ncbi:MAG: OmpA family protein, partial [Bacteroidales bacterium]|nr:OmpA family protein [Bacteroidales bacterium]
SYILGNINSDSGELRILKESTQIFEQLLKIMKLNTDLKIEIGWHTDSKGQDAENKRLSQNRADFAVNYLVINGIEKERAVGKGYGESQLINKCKNGVQCSEDEHKENRRIEFKIIGFLNP